MQGKAPEIDILIARFKYEMVNHNFFFTEQFKTK